MWNVVQIKTLYQYFSAQICLLCSFPFLFKGSKDVLLALPQLSIEQVN